MKKTHDLCAAGGEYQDRNTGQTKPRWINCGALMQDEQSGRISIKLESMPVGNEFNGWLNAFPVDHHNQPPAPRNEAPADANQPY